MLTFEDFFLKKKIDLLKLQVAEPVLFAAFSKHYPLMGEKSFDHAKKYWFNNLRRTYPLPEQAKPHPVLAEAISDIAVQGIAVAAAQNLDAGLEKPKFKEDELAGLAAPDIPVIDISLAEAEQAILQSKPEKPKPAFKPKINPKNSPRSAFQPKEENIGIAQSAENQKTEVPEPISHPQLDLQNAQKEVIKTVSEPDVDNDTGSKPTDVSKKPAFIPRFNLKNIPKPTLQAAQATEAEKPKSETSSENLVPEPEIQQIKAAYKPRFQMKNVNKTPQSD